MIVQGCGFSPERLVSKGTSKIAFFDRDGVINKDLGYVHKKEQFILTEGIEKLLKHVLEKNYLIVIVTNQSGIERGYYTKKQFYELTNWYTDRFKKKGIEIAMTVFCPHKPTEDNLHNCIFRKPNPMMINFALKYFNADPEKCFLVGDKISDIEAARRAGVKNTFLYKNLGKDITKKEKLRYITQFEEINLDE